MINIKTKKEIEIMREGGHILALVLKEAKDFSRPGMSTLDIDKYVGRLCLKYKVMPAFRGYQNYGYNVCASVNDEIVHGVPKKDKILKEGDMLSLDFGVLHKGFNTDAAITFGIGKIDPIKRKLIDAAEKSFFKGAKKIKDGAYLGDVSAEIQKYIESKDFSVIRSLAGHGIGREIHEEPSIANFGKKGTGVILKEGMTLAIEPMLAEKGFDLRLGDDGWTYSTIDGGMSSHFEHTIAVTKRGYDILTA